MACKCPHKKGVYKLIEFCFNLDVNKFKKTPIEEEEGLNGDNSVKESSEVATT